MSIAGTKHDESRYCGMRCEHCIVIRILFSYPVPFDGDWDCDYYDELNGQKRYVKGEWIFRRVLEEA